MHIWNIYGAIFGPLNISSIFDPNICTVGCVNHLQNLDPDAKARYISKITISNGLDPLSAELVLGNPAINSAKYMYQIAGIQRGVVCQRFGILFSTANKPHHFEAIESS